MTGAVTVSAIVGLLSLFSGVALGWYLRRTNDWCPTCGEQLTCGGVCQLSLGHRAEQPLHS
ncbi:hypothetical protein FB565_004326 [Actinoplanes lutulentus]|uniref:Uncharacterized protein n=1 Tax=Actinoplanes lutulentus TaxID=1287878 RepID=A0A327Z0V8_9ACTN|nr:hypothetical protein [Actinoplanes lutulentus]RAK27199.1 hypothetical protein B0I29_12486 [Actinoplanes lutulentus]